MSFAEHLRKQLPFSFHTPTGGSKTFRDIIYGRPVDGVEDKEDALCACTEVVEQAMEQAFRMGLVHGIEYGQTINRTAK